MLFEFHAVPLTAFRFSQLLQSRYLCPLLVEQLLVIRPTVNSHGGPIVHPHWLNWVAAQMEGVGVCECPDKEWLHMMRQKVLNLKYKEMRDTLGSSLVFARLQFDNCSCKTVLMQPKHAW